MKDLKTINFNADEYDRFGNMLGEMLFDALNTTAAQMASMKGVTADTKHEYQIDVAPLVAGVVGGLANYMLSAGMPPDRLREELIFRFDEIVPQIELGLKARALGGVAEGGRA